MMPLYWKLALVLTATCDRRCDQDTARSPLFTGILSFICESAELPLNYVL